MEWLLVGFWVVSIFKLAWMAQSFNTSEPRAWHNTGTMYVFIVMLNMAAIFYYFTR